MSFVFQFVVPNQDGSIRTQNQVIQTLAELPLGEWVLPPGSIKPAFLDDRGHGKLYPTLPRYTTEQIRTLVQVIQPKFAELNETTTWYMAEIAPRLIETINKAQQEYLTAETEQVQQEQPKSLIEVVKS